MEAALLLPLSVFSARSVTINISCESKSGVTQKPTSSERPREHQPQSQRAEINPYSHLPNSPPPLPQVTSRPATQLPSPLLPLALRRLNYRVPYHFPLRRPGSRTHGPAGRVLVRARTAGSCAGDSRREEKERSDRAREVRVGADGAV